MLFRIYLSKIIIYFFLIFLIKTNSSLSLENKIILKIDNEIITTIDVELEKNYLIALNPNIKNLNKKELNTIAKNSLIRERIKEREILKYIQKIDLDQNYLNKIIKERYSRLNLDNKDQFLNYLKNFDLKIKTIEKKISIEALWNQLIFQKFSKNVKIDEKKLLDEIKRKKSNIERNLLLSEIVFKISKKDDLNNKYNEIIEYIKLENFESAALNYSISDSSRIGGKLGWINQNSLNNIIKNQLSKMNTGDITKPIFTPNGYVVLRIDDIKNEVKEINMEAELKKLIKINRNQQLNQQSLVYFNKIKKNININEL